MKENNNEHENIVDILKIGAETKNADPEKYKLQCMLPDYVLNKLTEQERSEFEQAVTNYPDLSEEVKDAQDLFNYIEKFDYKKMMYDKTQYLPDRVVAHLEKQNKLYKPYKTKWKRLIAVGTFAAVILVYFYFANNTTQIENAVKQHNATDFFTEAEKHIIAEIDDIELYDIDDIPTYLQEALLNNDIELEELDDYYFSTIRMGIDEIMQSYGTISDNPENDFMYLIEELENIDENYFQTLLNQIENL